MIDKIVAFCDGILCCLKDERPVAGLMSSAE